MEMPRMLSGSELVAKGATRKVDGQLPEVGLKEVSPNGSWLEQKQIQSALEGQKHFIEVERIDKSGSLSHAIWRDDLKLAEVTKKTGGHWQYIGHNVGKNLYLLPEETLFLIEVNRLLLKHNQVTVSIQKAYSLCLSETPIAHYKVYASLSRLGYRVFRHKEPDVKTNIRKAEEGNVITTNSTASEEYSQISQTGSIVKEQKSDDITNDVGGIKEDVICTKNETNDYADDDQSGSVIDAKSSNDLPLVKTETPSIVYSDESDSSAPLIDADNIKVEMMEKAFQSSEIDCSSEFTGTGDEIPPMETPIFNECILANVNINISITTEYVTNIAEDQSSCMPKHNENLVDDIKSESNHVLINDDTTTVNQETNMPTSIKEEEVTEIVEINTVAESEKATPMNIDSNFIETNGSSMDSDNIESSIASRNEYMETEKSNSGTLGTVYSVDEYGVIRVFAKNIPIEADAAKTNVASAAKANVADAAEMNVANDVTVDCDTAETADPPGPSTNDSTKHFDEKINHYNAKMQKLIEINCNAGGLRNNLEGLNSMQDFYREQVVGVNCPDEKYLPRNIFLHRPAYLIDMDTVRNQKGSNVSISSDEMDSIEPPSRASRGTDAPSFADLPRFAPDPPYYHAPPRYPAYRPFFRPPPHWGPRPNYNSYYNYNMFRTPTPNYFFHPRYRYQAPPFVRQHFTNFNVNARGGVRKRHPRKQSATLKLFHYNAIVHIATRFKKGIGRPAQVQALNNLLCTYNSRYGEHLELSREFEIIDRKKQDAREVIVLDDDEPIRKKARLDDATAKNNNLVKLKELAAKLKELHMKNLAVSQHRRVFSRAIKAFNKWFNADLYLDSNFTIKDRKLIVLDSSSDSDAVVFSKEKEKPKKNKRLRNPYNILKNGSKNVNIGASTSREVPILHSLFLDVNNEAGVSQNGSENNINTFSPVLENSGEGLLKYFNKVWLPSDDDFGRAELCSRESARLDSYLLEAEYLYEVLKESGIEFESWLDLKLTIFKEILASLDIQKQQAEALSNDFLMETGCQIQPILEPNCTDVKTALKQLAIIPTNKKIPIETSLTIHFDVCNRDVHIKKSSPPKPNFRVICCDESDAFPTSDDVVALHADYNDTVPIVFAFIGISGSVSYLQINPTDLPVFIPDYDLS